MFGIIWWICPSYGRWGMRLLVDTVMLACAHGEDVGRICCWWWWYLPIMLLVVLLKVIVMLMVTLLMMFVTPDSPVADLLQIHRHLGRVHCPVESHHSSNLLMCGFTNNFFLGFFSTLTRTSLDISTLQPLLFLHYLIILPSVHFNFVTFIAKFSKSAYYIVR